MRAETLTRRQASILRYIADCIRDHGYPPTIAEIGRTFRIASTNGVNDHLVALRRKGYITRSSKARGIHLTEKAAGGLYRHSVGLVPLVGRVAAGAPLLAEENIEGHVMIDPSVLRSATYCLRVQGDSMVGAGILEGDVIIVDQSREPRPGDVVVALVGDEATVKRYYPQGERVELRPENPAMAPLHVPADALQVQGVVIALQRTLS